MKRIRFCISFALWYLLFLVLFVVLLVPATTVMLGTLAWLVARGKEEGALARMMAMR